MVRKLTTAISEKVTLLPDLSKTRLETPTMLITGIIGTRTENLRNIAC